MFNERLKQARLKAKLSKASFAKKLGLIYTTYDNYERGTVEPKVSTLIKIADILNISTDDLLGRIPNNEDERLKKVIEEIFSTGLLKVLSGLKPIKLELVCITKDSVIFNFYYNTKCINKIAISKSELIQEFNFIDDVINREKNKRKEDYLYSSVHRTISNHIKELEKNNTNNKNTEEINRSYEALLAILSNYPEIAKQILNQIKTKDNK